MEGYPANASAGQVVQSDGHGTLVDTLSHSTTSRQAVPAARSAQNRGEVNATFNTALSFTDPDDFASSVPPAKYQLTVTQGGRFAGEIFRVNLPRLLLHRVCTNLPWVLHTENAKGRELLVFNTQPGANLMRNAVEVPTTSVVQIPSGHTSYQRAQGPASRGSISLRTEAMAEIGASMAGVDLTCRQATTTEPSPANLATLRRIHAAAIWLAQEAPHVIANPTAAQGLEAEIVGAMVACVTTGTSTNEDRTGLRRRDLIMRRFRDAVEARPDCAIYISDLCSEIGVPARTLSACCQEYLGMGAQRFLWLRRMQMTRRALARADRAKSTVTDIVTSYGFWELGRFAVKYRSFYGESPSATLRRDP
jgi:AraC-like DNA-binding protein